ncbi:hypothetical protein BM221_009950 [Beauveria bassiana]|uniref:Myb-like domain-containing protein n=1 Tax=Beauveria bassiana TaxID=176275 RepID=A0A2N6NA57_BEABA|nr:hypothetical protein BM221_009950 [Beauveria bassiana]
MKASKHSRQQSDSVTSSRRREALARNTLAQAQSLLEARHRPSSGAWSIRDDQQLITARSDGLNWSQIQERFFPSKSSNACRKRHERLIDSKGRGSDEAARMERIATHYVLMREKLWRPLADLTDEKWSFVEKTCLSSGLKNLQGVAKAANRRQRYDANAMAAAAAAAAAAGYDDDSGISGIGLTPVDENGTAASALAAYHSSPVPPPPPSPHGGGNSSGSDVVVGQSFASTTSQAASATTTTTTAYLAHPHHLAQAHLHPAYTNIMYGGGGGGTATQYHPQHAYSSSISSEGSLHPGYVSRRGNESA